MFLHSIFIDQLEYDYDEEEAIMTELALQLQLQTQSVHDEIGRYMVEVGAMIPRLAADVSRIGVGLNGMKEDADSLIQMGAQNNADDVDQEIHELPALKTLSSLHAFRDNLIEVRSICQAASSWDGTVASMHELIGLISVDSGESDPKSSTTNTEKESEHTKSLAKAVEALGKLEYAAIALNGTPRNEERQEIIASFRSKIEVLLKPILLHALQMQTKNDFAHSGRSLGPLHQCVSMYKTLEKLDVLKDEYVKSRPANIHKLWFASYTPPGSGATAPEVSVQGNVSALENKDTTFVEWLPSWYDACLKLIAEERRRSSSVFDDNDAPFVTAKVSRVVLF